MAVPCAQFADARYLSLATYKRNGQEVRTPLWFAQHGDTLYVKTRDDSWKYKRVRNNPQVRVARCDVRGQVTGEWEDASARVLHAPEDAMARTALRRKYWLLKVPFLWSKHNVFISLEPRA